MAALNTKNRSTEDLLLEKSKLTVLIDKLSKYKQFKRNDRADAINSRACINRELDRRGVM